MKWFLWADKERPGPENMAIDEVLLQHAARFGCVLRFYGWLYPTVSIGYFQPLAAVPAGDYNVVRRPSGGGVVDHRSDFTFSLIFSNRHPLFQVDRFESYRLINQTVAAALQSLDVHCWLHAHDVPKSIDRRHMQCFVTPARFDVIGETGKLCGGARRRRSWGMLHQGSICVERERRMLADSLSTAFESLLGEKCCKNQDWLEIEHAAAELESRCYGTDDWLRRR